MTKLLISVRSVAEARLLPLDRVGIVDVKEPDRGPLGASDFGVVSEIVSYVDGEVPVSAALGELADFRGGEIPELSFAKLGLSGVAPLDDWKAQWRTWIEQFPAKTRSVAVIYADWDSCEAPSPGVVFDTAVGLNCSAVLVDTFDKNRGNVFAYFSNSELEHIRDTVQNAGMKFVLAGGIRSENDLVNAVCLAPDFIGVRGAVCDGERSDSISPAALESFLDRLDAACRS